MPLRGSSWNGAGGGDFPFPHVPFHPGPHPGILQAEGGPFPIGVDVAQGRVVAQGQEEAVPGDAPAVVVEGGGQGQHRRHLQAPLGRQVQGQVGADAQAADDDATMLLPQFVEDRFHLGVPVLPGAAGEAAVQHVFGAHRIALQMGNGDAVAGFFQLLAEGGHFVGVAVEAVQQQDGGVVAGGKRVGQVTLLAVDRLMARHASPRV